MNVHFCLGTIFVEFILNKVTFIIFYFNYGINFAKNINGRLAGSSSAYFKLIVDELLFYWALNGLYAKLNYFWAFM